jgi:hypothetical protein
MDTALQVDWDVSAESLHLLAREPIQQRNPAVVADAQGNIVVVWQDSRLGADGIYAQRLDLQGQRMWPRDVAVSESMRAGKLSAANPAIAAGADGWLWVVWEETRDMDSADVYAQCLDVHGNHRWPAPQRVSATAAQVPRSGPGMAWLSGGPLVAWIEGESVYAQRLNTSTGKPLWTNDVEVSNQARSAANVRVATGNDGNAWVAWARVDWAVAKQIYGATDFWAQRIAPSGALLWAAPKTINANPIDLTNARAPALAVDAAATTGDAVFAWLGLSQAVPTNAQGGIFAQRLNDGGMASWMTDTLASGDTPTETQRSLPVVAHGGGLVRVFWMEPGPAQWQVLGQSLGVSGMPLFAPPLRVSQTTLPASLVSPTLALAQLGNGANMLAWSGMVSSSVGITSTKNQHSVFALHTGSGLTGTWNHEVRVAWADTAYFFTGTVTSMAIDEVTETVRSAMLGTKMRLNGGDVRFYLSNDGGANWVVATPGVMTVFTTTGSDLRWRAELSANDDDTQTPVVETLQIEYETSASLPAQADAYEQDDACATARMLASAGQAQQHNFHRNADADWVQVAVRAGETYVVEAAASGNNANLTMEVQTQCNEVPFVTQANEYSRDARVAWHSTYTGSAFVRVSNQPIGTFGTGTDYELSARSIVAQPQPLVIIVAGGLVPTDTQKANVSAAADRAYRVWVNTGLPKSRIQYLTALGNHDADGNGLNDDVDGQTSAAAVRDAIQIWPRDKGIGAGVPLFVVFVAHGMPQGLWGGGAADVILASDIDFWLRNLERATGADATTLIFDAAFSAGWLPSVDGTGRVVVASAGANQNAYATVAGLRFSDVFWTSMAQNMNVAQAWQASQQALRITALSQTTTINSLAGAAAAHGLVLLPPASPPTIDFVSAVLNSDGDVSVLAQIRDDVRVTSAVVEVFAPNFAEPALIGDGAWPALGVMTATLKAGVGASASSFAATLAATRFPTPGCYRLLVQATDGSGYVAIPQAALVCVTHRVYLPVAMKK